MAPEEVPPELQALLTGMEGFQEAAVGLAAAEQELGAPPDLRIPGNVMDEWSTAANAHTGLWRGLARVLEAGHAALLAGTYMVGPELQMALNKHLLFPFLFRRDGRQLGGINLYIPMWPVQVLQRCAAAFFLHAAEPELAAKLDPLAMLEKALEGVWPGCTAESPDTDSKEARAARKLLTSRQWVPALPEPAAEPGSSPTSPACTDLGIELAVALLEQCPGTSLQDVRRWALLLWLDMAGSAALQRLPRARPVPRLLVVCQQALSSGLLSVLEQAKVVHIACKVVYGSELTTAYVQSRPGRHLVQLVEAALARAEAGAVHLKAATLARELCALLMARSKGEGAQAQAASVARIDELMAKCSAWLQACKPWLPAATVRQLATIDRELKRQLEEGKRLPNTYTRFGVFEAPDLDTARCSHCDLPAPHLRACSACRGVSYCSRGCQVAHWRAPGGHKADCARLAAERQARGGGRRAA